MLHLDKKNYDFIGLTNTTDTELVELDTKIKVY